MGDLISRQAAIDCIERSALTDDSVDTAIRLIEVLPSAQPDVIGINVGDTISRQAVLQRLTDIAYNYCKTEGQAQVIDWIKTLVCVMPSAQPERKKGRWSFIGDNMFECTCCGTPYTTQQLNGLRNYNTDPYAPNFCPNCGADMRGDQDE